MSWLAAPRNEIHEDVEMLKRMFTDAVKNRETMKSENDRLKETLRGLKKRMSDHEYMMKVLADTLLGLDIEDWEKWMEKAKKIMAKWGVE